MRLKFHLSLFIVVSLFCGKLLLADSFGINLYGLSYHMGQNVVNRDRFNEFNKGIGFRADFGSPKGHSFFFEGGKYSDSFRNDARYLSVAFQFRIIYQLRLGLNAAIYNSKSANHGETFFAPVPILSYRIWRIVLNAVYLPKHEPINPYYILGGYMTINLVQTDK